MTTEPNESHSAPQAKVIDGEFMDRLTRESQTGVESVHVPVGEMGRDAARKFFLAIHNVERGGVGGRKNLSESFAVELISWRGEDGVDIRFVTSDDPTRKRFARHLSNYAESESAVEVEAEPFMDVSPGDSLAATALFPGERDSLTQFTRQGPIPFTGSIHDVLDPFVSDPFETDRFEDAPSNALNPICGESDSGDNATVMVQFVCLPAIYVERGGWICRNFKTEPLSPYRHGYHINSRVIAVSGSLKTATKRVAQTARCYRETHQVYPDQSQRSETVALRAASRDWGVNNITLPHDKLAVVTHPPVTAAQHPVREEVGTDD